MEETLRNNPIVDKNDEILSLLSQIKTLCEIMLHKVNTMEKSPIHNLSDDKIQTFLKLNTMEKLLEFEHVLQNDEEAANQLVCILF